MLTWAMVTLIHLTTLDTRTMPRQEKHMIIWKKGILFPLITLQKNHTKFHQIYAKYSKLIR